MSKLKQLFRIALVVLCMAGMAYISGFPQRDNIWGDSRYEPYMVIAGKKPVDAVISVRVRYFGRGEECSGWSWSASDGKVRTGHLNENFKIEHNFSTDPTRYELRVPYCTRQPESGCFTKLSNMEVKLTNDFDTVGFANLRIHRAGTDYDNKPLSLDSKIEARGCEPYYSSEYNRLSNGFGCYYYVNGKALSKDQEFNAEYAHFDFSEFNDKTIIHYDILEGENYRSEPLDPQKGP